MSDLTKTTSTTNARSNCCGTYDCKTCSCGCEKNACHCRESNCQCGCRKPGRTFAGEKRIPKAARLVLGLALALVLGVSTSAAQQPGACQTGTLVGFDTRTQTIGGLNNGHYEEKVRKNGNKTIDGNSYSVEQTQEFYVLTVEIGEMIYTAESVKNLFFGYNPTDMVVNDPIEACVQKNKLLLTRPDGKKYKTRIVRQERVRSTGRAVADGMSSK